MSWQIIEQQKKDQKDNELILKNFSTYFEIQEFTPRRNHQLNSIKIYIYIQENGIQNVKTMEWDKALESGT